MNILFLTLQGFDSIKEHSIYTDLLREFVKNGHHIYAISPIEKRQNQKTHLIIENNVTILRLQIGNTQKTSIIKKGISTIMLESTFKNAIKKYFSHVTFMCVLYSTPPITLVSAIEYVKKRDKAKTYLLLKDIFPQNAVDIGMMKKKGIKGVLYKHFRRQEKKLYAISDCIGCMSPANVDYILKHNPEINPDYVEVCPNSIEVSHNSINRTTRAIIREKYKVPLNKVVFVYGGNLGKPQGIPFLIECIEKCADLEKAFFLIVGDGTEYNLINDYINNKKPQNVLLLRRLPKNDFDMLVKACDVGIICLDYRFTIPNFPSRLLSYMQAKLPVLAITDQSTDIGRIITEGEFGWWCSSDNSDKVVTTISNILKGNSIDRFGENSYRYLNFHYSAEESYAIIINSLNRFFDGL